MDFFTQASPLRRWAGTNLNVSGGFTSRVPTTTKPVDSATFAVLDLVGDCGDGALVPTWMKLLFILLGADNDVASFRLIGWNRTTANGVPALWTPQPFGEFACTASTAVGVAGSAVLNTERFADTIAPVALKLEDQKIAAGTSVNSEVSVYTPADNTIGHVIIPTRGYELLSFDINQTTNTPPGNIVYSYLR